MRRLLRWTFNTLAMASLLLCLATAGLWVRSYWVEDELFGQRREASGLLQYACSVWSHRGHFEGWVGWTWAFAFLAPGPALGVVAMLMLRGWRQSET